MIEIAFLVRITSKTCKIFMKKFILQKKFIERFLKHASKKKEEACERIMEIPLIHIKLKSCLAKRNISQRKFKQKYVQEIIQNIFVENIL